MTTLASTQAVPAPQASTSTTFESLGVSRDLVEALATRGIREPFPIQTLAIPDALAGRDVSGMAQTGSGKTLAFGIPMVERTVTSRRRRPQGLVLVPTRELANQVTDELASLAAARGLWVAAIYGGASMMRQIRALHAGVDIVVATPGRLNDLLERGEVSVADVSFVTLDEADQMADMGFLPQIERILDQIDGQPQTLLFSATLDGAVGTLVRRYQQDPVRLEVASRQTTNETLEQRFIGVSGDDKIRVAARICAGVHRAIVFSRTTHGADRLARQLDTTERPAVAIHGRLSQSRRERMLARFASGSAPVLVATNVAARGLHIAGVDIVMHYDPPEDGKTYLHRSGRTARAGAEGLVVSLVTSDQTRDIVQMQREAGIDIAIVPMRSGDERLDDLAGFEPPEGGLGPMLALAGPRPQQVAGGGGSPRGRRGAVSNGRGGSGRRGAYRGGRDRRR